MQQDAAWLVSQVVPYLPSRDRKDGSFRYGSSEVFDALREAGIVHQNSRHPDHRSLERVELSEGIKLVSHRSDPHCALLLNANNEQIAHVYFHNKLGNWILYTPQSGSSPLNKGSQEAAREILDDLADAVEEFGDAVADGAKQVARRVGGFVRRLDLD